MLGNEEPQYDQEVRHSLRCSKVEKGAEIGDNHVAHSYRPSFQVEEIARKERVMPGGWARGQDCCVWGEANYSLAFEFPAHRRFPHLVIDTSFLLEIQVTPRPAPKAP
jgi:hypothetical protein